MSYALGFLSGLAFVALVWAVLYFKLWFYPYLVYFVVGNRIGWYQLRKEQGHPISLRRALFGKIPRFGSYEEDEPGCPDWAKRDYLIVKEDA